MLKIKTKLIYFSTFQNQKNLQRLPIPDLNNLKSKYLKSLKPILTPQELENSTKAVNSFCKEFGKELQERLISYGKDKDNWLEELWLKKAYLEWREPSLINVNYWCQFVDHPKQPKDLLIKPPPDGILTEFQITRAAGLISNMLNFNDRLNDQTYPPEFIKDAPLCMNQYTKIFGTTRVPGEFCDTLVHQYPTSASHIIVLTRNKIFKVDVLGEGGIRVGLKDIERQLLIVGEKSLESFVTLKNNVDIGVLTAGHRDNWFKAYTQLKQLSKENNENLSIISDALFAVCLDDAGDRKNLDQSHLRMFHNWNGSNRWFDKSIQLIVSNSGKAGLNGEHSPSDAVVPGQCTEYILKNEPAVDPLNLNKDLKLPEPVELNWTVDKIVSNCIEEAKKSCVNLINDTQSCLLQTQIYGSRYIKEVAKTSPDGYVQLALQLTYFRLFKQVTPVYESASSRLSLNGRTETGRTMSEESLNFITFFDNDNILYQEKLELFRKAIESHGEYMKTAAIGRGIDRHMLGLRCMIKPEEKGKETIFSDAGYSKSMNFKLSTSNMSPGRLFYGGFGPVVADGFGINYAIDKDELKFSISSKKSYRNDICFKFRNRLEQTLIDMMILFPKRSEVWGKDWRHLIENEKRSDGLIEKMKKIDRIDIQKQKEIADKYRFKTK